MNYLELLDRSYKSVCEYTEGLSKMDFLISHLFEIATYDSGQSEIIGKKLFETIDAINNRTTFDYIKDPENYTWYLMFCNFSFFKGKIEWGTSVRGAWWTQSHYKDRFIKFSTCALIEEDGEQKTDWEFAIDEWIDFMKACVEYSKQ